MNRNCDLTRLFCDQMGDGTNFVIVFAGELLQQAEYLMRMGLHPSEVIEGYRAASKKALEIIDGLAVDTMKDASEAELTKAVQSAIASKQVLIGHLHFCINSGLLLICTSMDTRICCLNWLWTPF